MEDLRPRFWPGSGRFSQSGTGPKRGCSGFPQSHRARSRVELLRNSNFSRTQSARSGMNGAPWPPMPCREYLGQSASLLSANGDVKRENQLWLLIAGG